MGAVAAAAVLAFVVRLISLSVILFAFRFKYAILTLLKFEFARFPAVNFAVSRCPGRSPAGPVRADRP